MYVLSRKQKPTLRSQFVTIIRSPLMRDIINGQRLLFIIVKKRTILLKKRDFSVIRLENAET